MRPVLASLLSLSLALALLTSSAAHAAPKVSCQITVEAGNVDRRDVPVRAEILVPSDWAEKAQAVLATAEGKKLPSQLVPSALLDASQPAPQGMSRMVLWWILPNLPAKQSAVFQATILPDKPPAAEFSWSDTPGKHTDLLAGKRPVLRYMYQAYENDPAKRDLNNKPFHHLFDPTGERLVTKSSGGFETHHQGLFYGFTSCTFEGGKCNTWYCHDGEHQLHKKVVSQVAGPILARHQVEIDWNDREGKTFCRENREMTAYAIDGGTLIEFASRLKSVRGAVTLDGDRQHAGFHFRADDEVNTRRKSVYFLRTTGEGNLGEEKNDASMTNLPWNAMSFMLGQACYTALYIDSPRNPKPAMYSERTYGRFGSSVGKQELRENGPPLELNYRLWLQAGQRMTVEQASATAAAFADPPKVKVVVKD